MTGVAFTAIPSKEDHANPRMYETAVRRTAAAASPPGNGIHHAGFVR